MKRFIICDENRDYAEKLTQYLGSRLPGADVLLYTDTGIFIADGTDITDNCICIMGEGFYDDLKALSMSAILTGGNICILSEDPSGSEDPRRIYRYRPAGSILERFGIPVTEVNEPPEKYLLRGLTRLITVYSPIGQCLKTTFAMTLSRLLSSGRDNERALYINLEAFSGLRDRFIFKNKKTVSDLIYDLRVDREKTLRRLGDYICEDGGFCMICPSSYPDLEDIDETVWLESVETLRGSGGFDYIILDPGSCIHGLMKLIGISDLIFVPLKPDDISVSKADEFLGMLEKAGNETGQAFNAIKLEFPMFENLPHDPCDLKYGDLASYIEREGLLSVI
ncbi:MAG: hypothetical protein K5886_09675 [Lachnospiraceae bacterium]|nr:hypothetical protein [Lachnospiraceae bacterium]